MIWYLSLTWGVMVFGFVALLWRFQWLDRKVEGIWNALQSRADVKAIEEGWVIYTEKPGVLPTQEPPIGFIPTPAAEKKGE